MITLPGYKVDESIHEGKNTVVYRGTREASQEPVVIKVHKSEYPTERELAKFKKEFEIGRLLETSGVVRPVSLEKLNNGHALVLEDFGGVSLAEILKKKKIGVQAFLKIAVLLADSLGEIHSHDVIHLDIKPHNIIINLQNGKVAITDFGISTQLSRENPTIVSPGKLEGTLPYISPEQTGRMNRAIDYRTDLYSLGITFYEMLLGRPPFVATDPMEMVHNHIAVRPQPIHELNSEIPIAISSIIAKLLAKNAEERYQSAFGLKADLEECLSQLKQAGKIEAFRIGARDFSDKFQIPQKLYGREPENQKLMGAFESVVKGVREIALVTGLSGIGKSAMVNEIHKPVLESRGYFIAGKYDQFKRDIPYSSIIQAFRELVRQVLTEDITQINQWKDKLDKALGENGQVIVSVIPEIELIIGKQKPVPELGPTENENRFNLVFSRFVQTFAQKKHPLVIFLDDMQWADLPSLKLIRSIVSEPTLKYLFWIFSYRDNEVDSGHPLAEMLAVLSKVDVVLTNISLKPLAIEHVNQLIVDTLRSSDEEARELGQLVHAKTNGNPFFVSEFLKSLYQEKLLDFSPSTGSWKWNLESIRSMGITDNVVELMSGKIQKLQGASQEIIRLASCIGNQFDLESLSVVRGKSPRRTAGELEEVLKEGLIQPIGSEYKYVNVENLESTTSEKKDDEDGTITYKFLHDRVQQAAYGQLSQNQREVTHLAIGRHLIARYTGEELNERLFDVVNHLNTGAKLIEDVAEKNRLIELDLRAARKARSSTAYDPAVRYLQSAISLLPNNAWKSDYKTMAALKGELADSANLSADFALSESTVDEILNNATDLFDKVRAMEVRIRTLSSQAKLTDAWQETRKVLAMLGVRLPKNATMLHVGPALIRTKMIIARRGKRFVIKAPKMTDQRKLAALRILSDNSAMAYQLKFELLAVFIMNMVWLTYKYGNGPASPYALSLYALSLSGVLGDLAGGEYFGKLALELSEMLGDYSAEIRGRTKMVYHNFVEHWTRPVNPKYFDEMLEAGRQAVNAGDTEYGGYSLYFRSQNMLFTTGDLPSIRRDLAKYAPQIENWGQQQPLIISKLLGQLVDNLSGESEDLLRLRGKYIDEDEMMDFLKKISYVSGTTYIHHHKAMLHYLFGDVRNAVPRIEAAIRDEQSLVAMIEIKYLYFYDGLIRARLCDTVKGSERRGHVRKMNRDIRKYRTWAKASPANHRAELQLLEAERARVVGNSTKAMEYYDLAIQGARDSEFLFLEGHANHLAAEYYLSIGKERVARTYMTDARYSYGRWGCPPIIKHLEKKHPELMRRIYSADQAPGGTETISGRTTTAGSTTGGESTNSLDIGTVMKAAQALSGEIFLDKLLATLMKIVVENAGAERGYLILEQDENLQIEAEGGVDLSEPKILQSIPVSGNDSVPSAIIQYVQRTLESVVLGDAASEGRFTKSPYVVNNKPKSVLCTPITKQGKLVGILYLENNLTTNAFTPDRVEILNILSAQAAISLENARLVADETERQKLEKEMEMAKSVQMSILPAATEDSHYNIAAHMTPAEQVGGDYYDYYKVGEDRWIAIGDVTGHGLNSGLLMLMAQTGFSTYLNSTSTPDTVELFKAVNRTLHNNMATRTKQNLYMTFTALRADSDGNFEHVGKHEDILVWRKATGKVEIVTTEGVWMGIVPDVTGMIEKSVFKLNSGDFITLFTDGVIECRNTARQQFDTQRLVKTIEEMAPHGIEAVKDGIVKACFDFMDHQDDDVTLFLMQKK